MVETRSWSVSPAGNDVTVNVGLVVWQAPAPLLAGVIIR